MGGLWIFRKSQKISISSDQYCLSYVNKTTGGGAQLAPPPGGTGLKKRILRTVLILNLHDIYRKFLLIYILCIHIYSDDILPEKL